MKDEIHLIHPSSFILSAILSAVPLLSQPRGHMVKNVRPSNRRSRSSMPSMTLTEKILARHAGRDAVQPGDNIWVDVDVLMTHDVCGPGSIGVFHQQFGR